jgi:regulator of telomere elongation helicase 1
MTSLLLEGVTVEFPYEPYQCQLDYMRSAIKAINGASNALLESPTGTGNLTVR